MTQPSEYALETLRQDREFILYRGRQSGNASPVLLFAPAAEQPSPQSLKRLEHEYSLAGELESAWAARPLSLIRHDAHTMLVLEDPGGEPLDRLVGDPMALRPFLRLAIGLAAALRRVHERGLVHKDIKPAHVLVNVASGEVWLTGFGIASRLPRERQAPEAPEAISGTLAYMAPEQTGRMNRSIDSRSDLYSLGVTLYEMLTGSLPFTASDPMEWVHAHIAKQPLPPNERVTAVPSPLSGIILKLLAKTAEERYQSAGGVEADFRRCLAEWESLSRIDSFTLGTHDTSDRLVMPERLYGRERETRALVAAFDQVVLTGAPALVLVSGYSGIGKSSVVNELHKVLVPPRGLFASGKFDQYKRDIPYATLAQAFQSIVRSVLGQSDAELARWRDAIQQALGPYGELMVNLIPELALIIGEQLPVPEVPPQDAQNRIQMVFRRFLGVFAREEHPLALFLDDLQWLDTATLDLVEHLVTHDDVRHLLLVGAYRDNEVGLSHPLMQTLATIRTAGARVQEIVLAALGLDDVRELASDALHCEPERVQLLAQLVHEKTGGNPFFAIQFFAALAEDGLLALDPVASAWQWDIDRIRARSYTDNVVDLMAGKLKRLSAATQEAVKQLACLGNLAETATLALVHGGTEEAMHVALWDAVHAGLVFRQDTAYKFLHDRIQQAAHSLIPESQRAEVHLAIGRALLADMSADELAEHLFDVANQLNRGAALLVEAGEKTRAATINLRAARKAKASAAYASARVYLAAGVALLDEADWVSQYELMFSLRLECAECEFLTGELDTAEQLLAELLQRGASKVDLAAAYDLKILLHVVKSENPQAVDCALACLKLFGIDMPAHPSWEQVQAEYATVWRNLAGRPIEDLIDLPLMTDPELQAAMRVLSVLSDPAFVTDQNLFCLQQCRMVNLTLTHGVCGASTHACGYLGFSLGPVFRRYPEGFRLAKLGCDLVEKHGFLAYRAKAQDATGIAAFWTQPLATAIDFVRASLRTAVGTGDLTYGCYGMYHIVILLLVRNDPLDAVWRESEIAVDFVHKSKFRDMEDIIVPQQRLIAAMQGRTAALSTFSDAHFDEAAFEAQLLAGDRMPTMICWYWITKAKARFLAGAYAEALVAADKAKALLWSSTAHFPLLDYYYYAALTVAALHGNGSADERDRWHDRLAAYQAQLREWAESCPRTFGDKHALVSAEIARLEARDADAMRLYEEAIRVARENGFVQNEAVAHELAAGFFLARGSLTAGRTHLAEARSCYARWGADGKVSQLDERMAPLREESASASATSLGNVAQLDLLSIAKASRAISGQIVLEQLVDTLMRIVLENAGAQTGHLILARDQRLVLTAEAGLEQQTIQVRLHPDPAPPESALPASIINYVRRSQQRVLLADATQSNSFSTDDYFARRQPKSVLCLPIMRRSALIGLLYLENNLATHAFTPERLTVLELLASQAAISLENALLYADLRQENIERKQAEEALREREARIRRLVESNIIGVFFWDLAGGITEANDAFLETVGYSRQDLLSGNVGWASMTPPEYLAADAHSIEELAQSGTCQPFEKEFIRRDGGRVPVLIAGATFEGSSKQGVSFVLDLTERKAAEADRARLGERLRQAEKMEAVGRLAGGVAHDFNNVLSGILAYGEMLFEEAPADSPRRRHAHNVLTAATRGRALVEQILAYSRSQRGKRAPTDLCRTVAETLELVRGSLPANIGLDASAPRLPLVVIGDATQLHQVVMNLCSNAIQAMSAGGTLRVALETAGMEDERALSHGTLRPGRYVRLTIGDSGSGMDETTLSRIFEPFFTTKEVGRGTGLGLSLVDAIVADLAGAIDVTSVLERGSTFAIYLPLVETPLDVAA
jgi:PAS domain S-box-containing protein